MLNLKDSERQPFLIEVVVMLRKEQHLMPLLKDVINKAPLRMVDTKMKRPMGVSVKNWDVVTRLAPGSNGLGRMPDLVTKYQKEFETWCNQPLSWQLPECLPALSFT